MCAGCSRPVAECECRPDDVARPRGPVRVARETKGRRGKGVTVISGVPLPAEELGALGTQLKKTCGSGGTVKDGVIEIQGDHRDKVVALLQGRGWNVKRAGG